MALSKIFHTSITRTFTNVPARNRILTNLDLPT
jgi:hypothetical protein